MVGFIVGKVWWCVVFLCCRIVFSVVVRCRFRILVSFVCWMVWLVGRCIIFVVIVGLMCNLVVMKLWLWWFVWWW